LRAHREQPDVLSRGLAKPYEERIVERVGLGPLGSVGGEGQVHELFRLAHRQRPEDQRVDQRERCDARTKGQCQRHDGGAGRHRILPQHAHGQAHVAGDRIEPGEQLDVEALLAQPERAAEPPRHFARRGLARHARGHQLADALVNMELELLVELAPDAAPPEDVCDTGPQRHRSHLRPAFARRNQGWQSATRASGSCRRPR
jgi:hypothetical protein